MRSEQFAMLLVAASFTSFMNGFSSAVCVDFDGDRWSRDSSIFALARASGLGYRGCWTRRDDAWERSPASAHQQIERSFGSPTLPHLRASRQQIEVVGACSEIACNGGHMLWHWSDVSYRSHLLFGGARLRKGRAGRGAEGYISMPQMNLMCIYTHEVWIKFN